MILCSSVYVTLRVYVLSNDQLSALLGEQLADLLDLAGADVAEPDQDDLGELVEEAEAPLDNDLLFVAGVL
jgi:hypothetical protein